MTHPRTFAFLALSAVLPATARAADPAQEWLDALGGAEALDAAGVHTRQAVSVMGLEGVTENWYAADGRHRMEMDLGGGVFHLVVVFDGTSGWQLDQNGQVTALSGDDLSSEVTDAYVGSWSHLLPGRLPGRTEPVGGDGLRLLPEGGAPRTCTLDPQTHLPSRCEQPADDRTAVMTYEGWAPVGGVPFPAKVVASTGDPQYDEVYTLQTAELLPEVDDAWFAPPRAEEAITFDDGDRALDIPIELAPVHVFLQVRVNDTGPYWFAWDTGAGATVIDPRLLESAGLEAQGKVEARGAGAGSVDVQLVPGVTFSVAGVHTAPQTVVALDLSQIEALMGREVDGILGYDFIGRFTTVVDYAGRKLSLYAPGAWEYDDSGTVLPMEVEGGRPMVAITVVPFGRDPIETTVLVDSGASSVAGFNAFFAEANDLRATLPKQYERQGGYGVGGSFTSTTGRMAALRLGDLELAAPTCGMAHEKEGGEADPDRAGLIGGALLKRTTAVFDYPGSRLVLWPNADFDAPFEADRVGMTLATGGRGAFHEFTVRSVDDGSPAAAAGVTPGDRLVSVDKRDASTWTQEELSAYVRSDRKRIKLVVDRDGQHKTLVVKPVDRI